MLQALSPLYISAKVFIAVYPEEITYGQGLIDAKTVLKVAFQLSKSGYSPVLRKTLNNLNTFT